MIYQVLSPFASTVNADSFKEAIKNFVKLNHNLNINDLIIKDQSRHMTAKINYYKKDGRNKVGINMYPINNYSLPINSNTYIPTNVIMNQAMISPAPMIASMPLPIIKDEPISPLLSMLPLSPLSPLSSVGSVPFIPSVINIPIK
jgi:hypothetical protein|uniref:Uncharacterized protein n=1 Tax=viral metagenome TaxID=1070528 RepID=A0A6C0ED92_9ZZZZ